jgi:putative transposase
MLGRNTTFTLTLMPTASQETMLRQHCGASRFAYNWGLATVKKALEERKAQASSSPQSKGSKVPWTGFDLINAFNKWKRTESAGCVDGRFGLPWQKEVCAQVFEEALVDLGRALKGFGDSKRGKRGKRGKRPIIGNLAIINGASENRDRASHHLSQPAMFQIPRHAGIAAATRHRAGNRALPAAGAVAGCPVRPGRPA